MVDAGDTQRAGDADLARRVMLASQGDASAEAELFRRFAPRVRLYGMRHLRAVGAADDLVQRVMLLTIEKLRAGNVQQPERIGSFILGTARMMAREARRASPADPLDCDHQDLVGASAPEEPEPLARAQLQGCLERLPERERTIVILSFFREQDSAEIGAALGMQTTHVRVARHRAIAQLRSCMGRREEVL